MQTRTIPELSVDTQVLMRQLRHVSIGETILYTELSAVIQRPVQRVRYLLDAARNRLRRDEGILFGAVMNVGLKRLDDLGVLADSRQRFGRSRRQAQRVVQNLTWGVKAYEALPDEEKRAYHLTYAQAGILVHMTQPQVARQLQQKMATLDMATLGRSLEAMRDTL